MFSKCMLCLFLYLLVKAVAYDNLALNQYSQQSSSYDLGDQEKGSAAKGNDGDNNNDDKYSENSCIHTDIGNEEAWWRVDLGFITRINEIKITYRKEFANRFAGFSIFVSNTSDFKNGIKCFKQSGSLPDVKTTSYPCTAIGQFVTVYNDRFKNTTYPSDYHTDGAVLELCEVEVPGCKYQRYGQSCGKNCFCKALTCGYKTGNCDGDCQPGYTGEECNTPCDPGYHGDKCLSPCIHCGGSKVCNQSGICLHGCEDGFYLDNSKICSKQCGQCIGIRCNSDGGCPHECFNGYYSLGCMARCSYTCKNKTCGKDSGKCFACEDGYFDEYCDAECPKYCLQRKCDISTGQCIGCEPGHYGYNCTNECLHCGGNKTCNDLGFCMNGCEAGYFSDHSPGCSLKEMSSNLILSLMIGISSGLFLVLLSTITNVIWNRRKRPKTETRSQIYVQSVDENLTEHVYSDIKPEIQSTKPVSDKELVDLNNVDVPQKGIIVGITTV